MGNSRIEETQEALVNMNTINRALQSRADKAEQKYEEAQKDREFLRRVNSALQHQLVGESILVEDIRRLEEAGKAADALISQLPGVVLKAVAAVRGERIKHYGSPVTNFANIANLRSALHKRQITSLQVALEEICLKMARLTQTWDHEDSLVDIIGYAICYWDIVQEIKRLQAQQAQNSTAQSTHENDR